MSEQKRESAWPKYPFESFPWDDSPSNNNRWVDAAEAEKAYDKLAAENERMREALERISRGQECSACSCECHAIALEVLKK